MSLILTLVVMVLLVMLLAYWQRARIFELEDKLALEKQRADSAESRIISMQEASNKLNTLQNKQREEMVYATKPENINRRDGFDNDWMPEFSAQDNLHTRAEHNASSTSHSAENTTK